MTQRSLLAISLGVIVLGLPACATGSAGHGVVVADAPGGAAPAADVADAAAVRGAVEGLMAADNGGNPDLAIGFYAEDAVLMPPEGVAIVGRDAIRSHYVKVFGQSTLTLTARSDETMISCDLAFDRGTVSGSLQARDGGDPSAVRDQYLMVLRRDAAGRWKVLRLMWGPVPPSP